jgi:gamma-glutamylaminecyclotransferase
MCLIIHKPKGKRIPADIIQRAKYINPHGFGITYLDSGKTRKMTSYGNIDRVLSTPRPLVCHFRYATVGAIDTNNIHPFNVKGGTLIYSNGTVSGFGDRVRSDIASIADDVLPRLNRKDWVPFLSMTDTRFAIVDTETGEVQRVGKWHERGGIYYSKANCFPSSHRVAVYGTLKGGYANSDLINSQFFLGGGFTSSAYPLEVEGLPYLHDVEGEGYNVEVELYDVDDECLDRLDSLEGHPNFYKRRVVDIHTDGGTRTKAWVYFIQNRHLKYDAKLYESYDGQVGGEDIMPY